MGDAHSSALGLLVSNHYAPTMQPICTHYMHPLYAPTMQRLCNHYAPALVSCALCTLLLVGNHSSSPICLGLCFHQFSHQYLMPRGYFAIATLLPLTASNMCLRHSVSQHKYIFFGIDTCLKGVESRIRETTLKDLPI